MKEFLKLLSMKNKESELSPGECDRLNLFLSKMEFSSIPEDQLDNVRDYLLASLNMDSVALELRKPLDALLTLIEQKNL